MSIAPLSSNTVVAPGYAAGRGQVSRSGGQPGTGADSAGLSGKELAKSLKAQGLTPSQIAMMMGSDVKTVDDYLGITATPAKSGSDVVKLSGEALAKSLKEQGLTPWQIAMMMGSDLKTVDDYLGITATPPKSLYDASGKTRAL